jgi:hypothetical protein
VQVARFFAAFGVALQKLARLEHVDRRYTAPERRMQAREHGAEGVAIALLERGANGGRLLDPGFVPLAPGAADFTRRALQTRHRFALAAVGARRVGAEIFVRRSSHQMRSG